MDQERNINFGFQLFFEIQGLFFIVAFFFVTLATIKSHTLKYYLDLEKKEKKKNV